MNEAVPWIIAIFFIESFNHKKHKMSRGKINEIFIH